MMSVEEELASGDVQRIAGALDQVRREGLSAFARTVLDLTDHESDIVREAAMWTLQRLERPPAVGVVLKKVFEDPEPSVRAAAAKMLGSSGVALPQWAEEITRQMLMALREEESGWVAASLHEALRTTHPDKVPLREWSEDETAADVRAAFPWDRFVEP